MRLFTAISFCLILCFSYPGVCRAYDYRIDYKQFLYDSPNPDIKDTSYCQPYLDTLKKVYDTMQVEYYLPVSEEVYNKFAEDFKVKVLSRLKDTTNAAPEIKYWGAGLLVEKLKDPSDTFSNFFPPKVAEEYKSDVLGYELGIGITGKVVDTVYLIDRVELRSDSYAKGIKSGDAILKINGKDIRAMTSDELQAALYPPLGSTVQLLVYFTGTKKTAEQDVKVIQFFKETLASVPTGIPDMFYVKINQFNEKTAEDFEKVMAFFLKQDVKKLVIDLRENGGGPPLAAREIAGIFLPENRDLFYFQRKDRPRVTLKTSRSPIKYDGKIAILIDKGSGSASELFAGTMKRYGRAILIGTPSAGKTYLKSMFAFEDKSMVVLVTSLAYLFDGTRYDPTGLTPDFTAEENFDLFKFTSQCMDTIK